VKFPLATRLVCCFQYKDDAESFYLALQERLGKFNLTISPEKSKIIAFGRFAVRDAAKSGKEKPDTFDFLGFTHYCSTSKRGKFRVKRRTSRKKYKAALTRMKQWIKGNRNAPLPTLVEALRAKLIGYYRYYGITDNYPKLSQYLYEVKRLLYKWLNRRSQRKGFSWDKFKLFMQKCALPMPKIYVNIYSNRLQSG